MRVSAQRPGERDPVKRGDEEIWNEVGYDDIRSSMLRISISFSYTEGGGGKTGLTRAYRRKLTSSFHQRLDVNRPSRGRALRRGDAQLLHLLVSGQDVHISHRGRNQARQIRDDCELLVAVHLCAAKGVTDGCSTEFQADVPALSLV